MEKLCLTILDARLDQAKQFNIDKKINIIDLFIHSFAIFISHLNNIFHELWVGNNKIKDSIKKVKEECKPIIRH